MLDADLAELYGVTTKALNQAVRRNRDRFPPDFLIEVTKPEVEYLNRSQIVTGSQKHRDPRYPPHAFTEQGVAMLSSVLRSKRAVEVNIEIMRAFVRLRTFVIAHKDLTAKLEELEKRVITHDEHIRAIFDAIRQLMMPPPGKMKQMAFVQNPGSSNSQLLRREARPAPLFYLRFTIYYSPHVRTTTTKRSRL